VVNHHQIAELADQFLLIGLDLHLRGLLFRHLASLSFQSKLPQMIRIGTLKRAQLGSYSSGEPVLTKHLC
jgi:hypothetical protein